MFAFRSEDIWLSWRGSGWNRRGDDIAVATTVESVSETIVTEEGTNKDGI
jgi:hypothetical protein